MSIDPTPDSGVTQDCPMWIQDSLAGLEPYGRSSARRRGQDRWWLRVASAARSWPVGGDVAQDAVAADRAEGR
jgi:hypothetical protein